VLLLLLLLQVAACQGSEGDATPFTDVKVDDVSEELHKRGYQRYGWEVRRGDLISWL
jgi:DNA-directed RNA polymerase II subunit RPB2